MRIKKVNELFIQDNSENLETSLNSLKESITFLKRLEKEIEDNKGIEKFQISFIKELSDLCTEDYFEIN